MNEEFIGTCTIFGFPFPDDAFVEEISLRKTNKQINDVKNRMILEKRCSLIFKNFHCFHFLRSKKYFSPRFSRNEKILQAKKNENKMKKLISVIEVRFTI